MENKNEHKIVNENEIEIKRVLTGVDFATSYDKATSGILYFTCPMGAGTISPQLFSHILIEAKFLPFTFNIYEIFILLVTWNLFIF